jgi:hypothetical protein
MLSGRKERGEIIGPGMGRGRGRLS